MVWTDLQTLDLLYSMTNPANVMVIVAKLVEFLRGTVDVYLRTGAVHAFFATPFSWLQ